MRQPDFEEGEYHFDDYQDFKPNYSPKEMITMGVFGGTYFNKPEYRTMIHPEVFDVDESLYNNLEQDKRVNKYKIKASRSRQWWEDRNLINHMYNTEGWFQWYCRFFYGRRCEDDEREIGRWKSFHKRSCMMLFATLKRYKGEVYENLFDDKIYPRHKQALLHWSINPVVQYKKYVK